MAERRSVVVKSSQRSVIKKVEVITVQSNNVASITARHPVGVVVAERRTGPPAADEPRPVFIPGCPLPQVLSREAADTEMTQGGERPTHGPVKADIYSPQRNAGQLKSVECRVTVKSSEKNKENYLDDKIYNPRVYIDSLPKNSDVQFEQRSSSTHSDSDVEKTVDSLQNSDSSVQFGQRSPCPPSAGGMQEGLPKESSYMGPPRYVLLHGDTEQTHDSISSGNEALERENRETSTESSRENQEPFIYNKTIVVNRDTVSSDSDSVAMPNYQAVNSSTSSLETDGGTISGSSEHKNENEAPGDLTEMTREQAARVIRVKRGSLSVRAQPHDLRHGGRGGCRSRRGMSVVSSGARGRGRGARVPQRGPGSAVPTVPRATHRQVTGPTSRAESRPGRMDSSMGASDKSSTRRQEEIQ
ncbi:uncharacterized protein LOC135107978 isoform X2 [Scylla paramamosain]|uniref:uncharacterized protein LOC135107978 isoform X2 n=1 Tax=Scylla paramamosain TaxID=85552 RepID=UPI003082B486